MKIAVIGAGIGGLAASCLLAKEEHEVTVFEKNGSAGGKMNRVEAKGFRFDTGPGLLTMPDLLEQLFEKCGADLNDYLTIHPLDPLCRYYFRDGATFDNYRDIDKSLEEIRKIAPEDVQAYAKFLNYAEKLYEKTAPAFLFNPLHSLSDLRKVSLSDFFKIDAFKTVSERVDSYFKSPYMRRFFKRFTTYNGSSPFQAPATLNVIPHVELTRGGFYVEGGLYQVALALKKLAGSLGVTFSMNSEVTGIITEKRKVTGIQLAGDSVLEFDLVVSNSDVFETYLKLLPKNSASFLRKRLIKKSEPSCSAFALLLGINRKFDRLRHHNVFFSGNYEKEFKTIFEDLLPPDDPTIYIANTSGSDPSHATRRGSNLFVLVNAPYLTNRFDWNKSRHAYSEMIINRLEQRGLKGLRRSIVFEQSITPLDFNQKYHSNRGSIYGTSSNRKLSAFLRPGNKTRRIKGLYLAGGSTHPGGGIPLVILSAMHACELIKRYE